MSRPMVPSLTPRSMSDPRYGFRLSCADVVVLLSAAIGFWLLRRFEMPLAWVLPCVVLHFFLFCNVFRVRRNYELLWAVVFLINVGWHLSQAELGVWPSLLLQLPVTVAVILAEMVSRAYHGIGARRLNRQLDDYLANRAKP